MAGRASPADETVCMARRRTTHRELALDSSHWRKDGQPKTRYDSRADALGAAEERRTTAGSPLTVYPCPYCNGWHMGRRADRAD